MIITRRRFVAGGITVPVAGVLVAKAGLPRLLTAPGKTAHASPWTIGLLGKQGELKHPSYQRQLLDIRDASPAVELVPADGALSVSWKFVGYSGLITGWGVWMPHIERPVMSESRAPTWPVEVTNGTLTLNMDLGQGYIARIG